METIGFYHVWEDKEGSPTWGGWKNLWEMVPHPVVILIGDKEWPEERINRINPRIEWAKGDWDGYDRKGKRTWIRLPSLYHAAVFGKAALVEGGFRYIVEDFEWWHVEETDGPSALLPMVSPETFRLENRGDVAVWNSDIQKQWKARWLRKKEGVIFSEKEKREFISWCRIVGEWTTIYSILEEGCDLDRGSLVYFKALCDQKRKVSREEDEVLMELRDTLWGIFVARTTVFLPGWLWLLQLYRDHPAWERTLLHARMVEMMADLPMDGDITKEEDVLGQYKSGLWLEKKYLMSGSQEEQLLYEYTECLRHPDMECHRRKWMPVLFANMSRLANTDTRNKIYHTLLTFMKPLKEWDHSESGMIAFDKSDTDFVASSSALMVSPHHPEWYLVNVRKVNYRIMPGGVYLSMVGGAWSHGYRGITRNEFYYMDRETMQPISPIYPMTNDIAHKFEEHHIIGIEDVRLVRGKKDQVKFYATTKEYSYLQGAIRIIEGEYDVVRAKLTNTRVFHPPHDENGCEKNWSWCGEDRYIYKWHPIELGRVDPHHHLKIEQKIPSPPFFREFRGSSPMVTWKGYAWFVTHSVVILENNRRYMSYLVALDLTKGQEKVVAYTPACCFENLQIEYSVGFDIDLQGRIVFLYSVNDATSQWVRMPVLDLLHDLIFPDASLRAPFLRTILSTP